MVDVTATLALRRRDRLGHRVLRRSRRRAHAHQQPRDQGRDLGDGHDPGDRADLPGADRRRGRRRRHRRAADQRRCRAPRRPARRLRHGGRSARPSSPSATGRARAARPRSRPASSAAPAGRSRRPTAPPGSPRRCTACSRRPPGSSRATRAARWRTPPGRVIGVDTAAGTGGAETGYAIPINTAMAAERQIVAGRAGPGHQPRRRRVPRGDRPVGHRRQPAGSRRPRSGASAPTRPAPPPRSAACRREAGAGVPASVAPVDRRRAGGRRAVRHRGRAAGLAAGDVITTADGRAVSSPDALTAIVGACRPGTVVDGHLGQPGRRDPDLPGPARRRPRAV